MPNLIQITDDVKQFLADGNTASVPAVTNADVNDGDILNQTRTIDLGNGYKFEITLPSGRPLESAPVSSDYPKRDAIMQWLGAVREAIVEDAASAGRAARDAALEAAAREQRAGIQGLDSRAATRAVSTTDPVEYAREQLRGAIERLAALSAAGADVAKWQRVVKSLTGEEDVPKRKRRKKRKVRKSVPIDSVN